MNEADTVIRKELEPGEVVRWTGRPSAVTLSLQVLPSLVFSVVWTGGVFVALLAALAGKEMRLLAAIPALMFCFGVFMLFECLDSLIAAHRTYYGVTDRRILTVEAGLRRRVTSWLPPQITGVERRDRADGRGDITFHQTQQPGGRGTTIVSASLVNIPEARSVEAHVRRLAATGHTAYPPNP